MARQVGDDSSVVVEGMTAWSLRWAVARTAFPAAGFSYGLERLQHALEDEKISLTSRAGSKVDALVVPVSAQDFPYAIAVAEHLRNWGWLSRLM